MYPPREFFSRLGVFALMLIIGNLAGYLIPLIYALQPSFHAILDLSSHQSALLDMYNDLDASSLILSPSAGTKLEFTDIEPEVMSSPLKLQGVKDSQEAENEKLFENLSLFAHSDLEVSFIWHAQYGEQDGALILESYNYRQIGQVQTNANSTHVFHGIPAGVYTLSAVRQSTGESELNYEITGTIARYRSQSSQSICTQWCKWSRIKHGARYVVISAGGQNGSVAMDGYFTYPHQLLFQSGEILIVVIAFYIAFVSKIPNFKSLDKHSSKVKAMNQV